MNVAHDPWTDPDPQPGDFDADLTAVDPRYVEAHVGNAKLTIIVGGERTIRTPSASSSASSSTAYGSTTTAS
jgi:hypothetical protein